MASDERTYAPAPDGTKKTPDAGGASVHEGPNRCCVKDQLRVLVEWVRWRGRWLETFRFRSSDCPSRDLFKGLGNMRPCETALMYRYSADLPSQIPRIMSLPRPWLKSFHQRSPLDALGQNSGDGADQRQMLRR